MAATVLAARLGLDTVDAMWDHVVESRADTLTVEELTAVLDDYFDAIRVGDATVSEREQYMASWIRAARERPGSGAVVVVCGGRHRPAIMSELARGRPTDGSWPAVPRPRALMSTSAVTWSPILQSSRPGITMVVREALAENGIGRGGCSRGDRP